MGGEITNLSPMVMNVLMNMARALTTQDKDALILTPTLGLMLMTNSLKTHYSGKTSI